MTVEEYRKQIDHYHDTMQIGPVMAISLHLQADILEELRQNAANRKKALEAWNPATGHASKVEA